jgi:hypothetical protein
MRGVRVLLLVLLLLLLLWACSYQQIYLQGLRPVQQHMERESRAVQFKNILIAVHAQTGTCVRNIYGR